jgi:hypothetical protein
MAKSISQIQSEISNFYLSIQNEITDVSTGSVAGGLIYAFSVALKDLYDNLGELERQAFIATASGRYLDLLIEGGFFLERPGSTRSTGYVLVYSDDPIVDPTLVGNGLICADYDFETEEFTSDISGATKFTGTNAFGSNSVSYVLIKPKNSLFVRRDALGRTVIDLRGKNAQYLLLPVVSVLKGTQVNLQEGSLNTFSNPPSGLRYVLNISNPGQIIFDFGGVSTAPLYSRNTTLLSYSTALSRMRVVNAFNFSSLGFLEITYRTDFPTRLIRGTYRSSIGEEINAGIVYQYESKTQTSISLQENNPFVLRFSENLLTRYDLINFTYNNIAYYRENTDNWAADTNTTLSDGTAIGPSTFVPDNAFFPKFFGVDSWVVQQRKEQVSEDIIFDPDNVLTDSYSIKEGLRLSAAADRFNDDQYKRYFSQYINSLPRGTNAALEFAALQVPGITFAKTVPAEELPVGTAVLLASADNGQLSADRKQAVYNFLKNDWVSAGVDLFVKAPELLEFTLSVTVTLDDIVFENSVKDAINISVANYLRSKLPGDEIKYGEVYSIISNIAGVRNVSELIIGKYEPRHYVKNAGNYVKIALKKLESYKPSEYFTLEESSFKESRNEIVLSSDFNGVTFEPVLFSDFSSVLDASYIFSEDNRDLSNNPVTYAAVGGIFSSDGGDSISSSSDYSFTFFSELSENVENLLVGVRFSVTASDKAVSVSLNGNSVVSTDVSLVRTVFIEVPSSATDVIVSFSASDANTIFGIQSFIHGEGFDSHLVGNYEQLKQLSFIEKSRINFIYGVTRPSSRYRKLQLAGYYTEEYDGRLGSLFTAFVSSNSVNRFQTILRDYQYGLNVSGNNADFFADSFADITKSDDPFIHFFTYAITSPFSEDFNSVYPLIPEDARNRDISDYLLSSRQISRFHQSIINPRVGLIPTIGIRIL